MGVIWPWERKKVQRELDSVEHMLESMFKPVPARPSFTTDLRKRLVGKPGPLAKASLTTLEFVLLVGGAILGTIVFVFTIGRSIIGLVGRIRPRGGRKQPPKPVAAPKHAPEPKKRAA
jgi:hypothetical protein